MERKKKGRVPIFFQMSHHLQTLVLARYNAEADQRVILATSSYKISGRIFSKQLNTIQQLVADDQFVSKSSYMITDEESNMLLFYNRDDVLLYFAATNTHFTSDMASKLFRVLKRECGLQFNPIAMKSLKRNGLQKQADSLLSNLLFAFNQPNPDAHLKEDDKGQLRLKEHSGF